MLLDHNSKRIRVALCWALLAAGLVWARPALAQSSLTFDGSLGQSQPAGAEPVPFIVASGAAFDPSGCLWTADGSKLYHFAFKNGKEVCDRIVAIPTGPRLGIITDNQKL